MDNGIEFVPFCLTEQCKSRDPVILVPGIMGTELFKYYDDQKEIWPNVDKLIFSITDNFLNDLALNTDGTENRDMPMKLGDIIRGTHLDILGKKYDSKTFEGLISELEKSGYIENANLFVFPYDWRKSNVVSAEKLKEKINKILLDTGADKVDLVAHSMGGLVVKKYIADNGADNVDQIIFIGTPQLGAPKAFKVIIEGDDMGVRIGKLSLLSLDKVKYISQNMPGVFELLPSKKYIDGQSDFSGNKYITDYITPSFSDSKNSIKPDLSFIQTEDFLKSQKINTKMLGFADNLHTDTDNLDLSNIKVSNFIGCGATKTIGHITVKKKTSGILFWKKLVNTYDLQYENGDDTVPLRSADNSFGKKYYVKGSSHGELPSASGLRELVTATLRGKKLIDFTNVSNDKHDCFIKGKSITLYSMLPMMEYLVYDEYDNFTGPVKSIDLKLIQDPTETEKSSEEIEYGIPGVQYNKIGGTTSIFLPAGGSYKIVVKNIPVSSGGGGGSAGGSIINSYDLSIGNINADDTSAGSVNFNNVRVNNPDESFQIEIPADTFPDEVNAGIPPVIHVDENGDGIYEEEIPPTVVLTDTQANDTSVPNTTGTISGNTVSLSASDENSGISNTQYSLDGGNTWTNYTVPIEINVVPGGSDITIQYFSTDNAGNIEPIQTITITAPPLPVPVIINNTRHSSGGIILLNLNNNLQDKNVLNVEQKVINKEKPKIDFSISDFKRTVLKEAQEPSLSKLNVNSKSIVFKDTQVHSSESSGKNLSKERQLASAVNSNQKIKPIWFFVIVVILSGVILIVRNYKKR
ncbi:MAG: alpha/beta hydrolase [bacterium]